MYWSPRTSATGNADFEYNGSVLVGEMEFSRENSFGSFSGTTMLVVDAASEVNVYVIK